MLQRHSRLGNYEVMELLGEGGMSLVYKARNLNDGRPVAIKVPDRQLLTSPGALRQFSREGNALVRLRHPHIVRVHACGAENGLPYIAMEYVDGTPLTAEMKSRRTFSVEAATRLLHPIGQALDYIHAQDIVHRDVKPGNIRLTRSGVPILVDFGIVQTGEATVWDDGKPRGSAWYMSPEQASGERASGYSDQYSLAVVAYEMLTGKVPFDGENPYAIVLQQRDAKAPMPADWSAPVKAVMERALEKDRNRRFSTCMEFIEMLSRAGQGYLPAPQPNASVDERSKVPVMSATPAPAMATRGHSSPASVSTTTEAPTDLAPGRAMMVTAALGLVLVAVTAHWFSRSKSLGTANSSRPAARHLVPPPIPWNVHRVTAAGLSFSSLESQSTVEEQMKNGSRFPASNTRAIKWQTGLDYPPPSESTAIQLEQRLSFPGRSEARAETIPVELPRGSSHAAITRTLEPPVGNHWRAGTYVVTLQLDAANISVGSFEVFDDLKRREQRNNQVYRIER